MLLLGIPELAQAEEPATSSGLGDIIVTARKRDEVLQQVPAAVSVVGSAQIARHDIKNAADLTAIVPNLLTPMNAVAFNAPAFFIRGVGQGDHNWNTENGVAVFIDDVYVQSTSGAWVDMLDFDRVEVLRGPQGTLYGRNSTSGAIKFVPRQPDVESVHGYAEAVIGNRSRIDLKAGINLPVGNGMGAIKLDTFRTANDGYLTRVDFANQPLDDELGRREHYGARVATLLRPSDQLELELSGDINRQGNGMNIVTPIVPADPDGQTDLAQLLSKRGTVKFVPLYGPNRAALEPLTIGGASRQTGGGVVFKATLDSDIGRFRSITAWRGYKDRFVSQLGGRGLPSTLFGVTLYGNVDSHEKVRQFTQEFQLTGEFSSQVDYTIGAYFFHNRWIESEYGATNGIPANLSPFVMPGQTQSFGGSYNDIDQTTNSWALFANLDWHLDERLTLSVGGRQTWDRKRLSFETLFEDYASDYPGFPVHTSKAWNRFTPRVGIDWRPLDDLLVYASFAKGYKVGNVEGARSSIATTAQHWLAPELATTWELGVKADWFEHRLRTNITAFTSYNTGRTDLISPDLVASSNIRSKGLEAELTFAPIEQFQLFANIGLLEAHYRKASANHPIFSPDPTGYAPGYDAQPVMTPKYTISAGAIYVLALPDDQKLTAEGSIRAVGKHFHALGINNFDSEVIRAYSVTDASLTWTVASGKYRVTAGAHNLFDKTYYYSGFFGSIPEFAGRYYADGRSWYLRIRYSI
ncbi:hypothetical protein JI59_15195 [Novosphingobium pentaromativorans US6-1]|uniref:TonB-dependent receptor n=1 Tax=Novosphingobium pentaromativorans US6-1 TaxID=1088721 RepID=G6E9G2_9SPHN|nr:hypothetical protein JI59_15195 [Novosphingobium pentaromativorans US6-1]EHJ62061.1 hypothetical protein NSU_0983 [Novosphingobium pentaromativorans US6-1]